MERTISVERLYTLAEFQNIKFINTLSNIPNVLANHPKVIAKMYLQQFLECDIAYLEYKKMREQIVKDKVEDVLGHLKQEREQIMNDLYEEIKAVQDNKQKETE